MKAKPKRAIASTTAKLRPHRETPSGSSRKKLVGRGLERAVEQFQSEPDEKKAHEQWKKIETSIFGVQFED